MSKKKHTPRPESESDIDEFLKRVELVRECSYFTNNTPIEDLFKISFVQGMEASMDSPPPNASRESVESFLMRMRPLMVYEEELFLGKVCTFVFYGKGKKLEQRMNEYHKIIKDKQSRKVFSLQVANLTLEMKDFVWLYLYGEFFHLQREKRKAIQDLSKVFGHFTTNIALFELEWWAGLSFFIAKDILSIRKGNLNLPPLPYLRSNPTRRKSKKTGVQ